MAGAIKRLNENGGARQELDKFYTKDEVALSCIETISPLISQSDVVVEPSAGAGAFSRQIKHPNLKAFDLEPENEAISQMNWFDVNVSIIGKGKLTVIGNPPFGVRSDLAKKFIKHAVSLGAETISFILPKTFSKALNQRETLYPFEYRLVIEKELENNSFTLEGDSFHVPCSWYVWTKVEDFKPGIDLRKGIIANSEDFVFVRRGSLDADFTINGNNGLVKDVESVTNPKAEHYIRVEDREKVNIIRDNFNKLEFDFKSSVNGGVAWVGQQEILYAYSKLK